MKTTKKFRCRGSLWNEVKESTLGEEYLLIQRPISHSVLRRKGVFVSAIDVTRKEVPKKYRDLLKRGRQ